MAPDYPEIEFISCTNQASAVDDLDNTHNAFANIYEGRYLAGVAGGMKLQQMIDEGTITAEEAVIGYVAAFPFAEVVSGYTAFYQGAKSVCPSVTMKVKYVNSWSDAPQEPPPPPPWPTRAACSFPSTPTNTPPPPPPRRRRVPLRLQQRHDRRGPGGQPHLLPAWTGRPISSMPSPPWPTVRALTRTGLPLRRWLRQADRAEHRHCRPRH